MIVCHVRRGCKSVGAAGNNVVERAQGREPKEEKKENYMKGETCLLAK